MRTAALVLALVAFAGCKSGRDYTSINRSSERFVFETFREGNQLRKKNLKQDFAFQHAAENKRLRKESIDYAWQSFWLEEWSGFSEIKRGIAAERAPTKADRLAAMRFGFLDSGD